MLFMMVLMNSLFFTKSSDLKLRDPSKRITRSTFCFVHSENALVEKGTEM